MLKFDIHQNPPTAEQIGKERERLQVAEKRLETVRAVVTVTVVAGIISLSICLIVVIGSVVVAGVVAGVGAGVGAAVVAGVGGFIEARINSLKSQQANLVPLSDIDEDRCPEVLKLCRQDAQCDHYRLSVAHQNRPLTVSEADMIKDWVENAAIQQAAEEKYQAREEACRLLQSKEPLK